MFSRSIWSIYSIPAQCAKYSKWSWYLVSTSILYFTLCIITLNCRSLCLLTVPQLSQMIQVNFFCHWKEMRLCTAYNVFWSLNDMLVPYGFMFVMLCFGTELLERVLQYLIMKIYIFFVIGDFYVETMERNFIRYSVKILLNTSPDSKCSKNV